MTKVVVIGAGLGGVSAAFELKQRLPADSEVMVINERPDFQFVPSNPWVALGERKTKDICLPLDTYLSKRKIAFSAAGVSAIDPDNKLLTLGDGTQQSYDYLVICTGPKLNFDAIPGSGPHHFTQSICTAEHAEKAFEAYQQLQQSPGPVIVGAFQGASCFGPAYEYIFSLDSALRAAKIRQKVPLLFVTSEPYIGHMGLGGVGDSKGLMEHECRKRDIKWICNAKTVKVDDGVMHVEELNRKGEVEFTHELPFKMSMMLPPFKGSPAIAAVPKLCNDKGFVLTDTYQRSVAYPDIYAAGVCVALPPMEATPVPVGVPKTGFMIESMTTAIVDNMLSAIKGEAPKTIPTLNAICLADMGDKGAAFVALPQNPPHNANWTSMGKWVHLAKIAFEKYFMYKVRRGTSEPIYEKYVLGAVGIHRTEKGDD
ncbi:NAD(P)/FAD-dependent oxidoreductase [Shewanella fodinae]|jgi:sulfide:quinone oxidoreductase|uniref:Sulfide-quinone reductase n=1 Tax=Shewanella fodinae TaxID=552357 RepID=A0A4R2FLF3_9GAMM|nr:FAD/NAD(P)-binding oxidoreductase [Shewanella fodinae]TCN84971.1 sulfide:quinone oxidoreductase [Shewanella fodinae]